MKEALGEILLTPEECRLAEDCLQMALSKGAGKARVTLSKSKMDLVGTLNGSVDKINSCLDRSLSVTLFASGKFGAFSTNRISPDELDDFLDKALETVAALSSDPFRDLPDPGRLCKNATGGNELGLCDPDYIQTTPEQRVRRALDASAWGTEAASGKGFELVSEEGEYSDSISDTLVLDSQGCRCRHMETNFDYGVEVTVKDTRGRLYSRYGWDSSTRLEGLDAASAAPSALAKAVAGIGPQRTRSRHCNMVLDRECSSRVLSPVLRALNGYSLQQNDSFLVGSLGQRIFPAGLDIRDLPHINGESGSRLFDSEGVATVPGAIIGDGVVKQYFINTYMAGKMGLAPTVEDPSRPAVMPFLRGGNIPEGDFGLQQILGLCGEGILVTDFNGGNSNTATGDFSFGVEGFAFKDGAITHPVHEMLITGNLLTLWQNLIAAGDDPRRCASRLVPTLAFADVSFSA